MFRRTVGHYPLRQVVRGCLTLKMNIRTDLIFSLKKDLGTVHMTMEA